MQRILYGADWSSSSSEDLAKQMQRCLLRSASQRSCPINSVVHPRIRQKLACSSRVWYAQLHSIYQAPRTFVPSVQLHLKSPLSPEELRLQSTSSTTDLAAVCLEVQSVCAFCSGGTCGCSDRLLNCIKQSWRGAPESTLTAVRPWMCL